MSDLQDKTTFTLAEAAELMSCHRETLRRAIHDGQLQAAKLGREFRISKVDLENFWSSLGGGTLFPVAGNQPDNEAETEKIAKKVEKKEKGPEQLSLLFKPDEND